MGVKHIPGHRSRRERSFTARPRRVAFVLLCSAGFLVTMAIASRFLGAWVPDLGRLFDPNLEGGLPAWFSQALHLVSALLCAVIFATRPAVPRRDRVPWLVLSFVFLGTSIDEMAGIHEALVGPFQRLTGVTTGALAAGWVFPVLLIFVVLCLVLARFFTRLPARTRIGLGAAALMFLAGAVGVELFAWSLTGLPEDELVAPLTEIFFVTALVEETLEMLGLITLVYVLLAHVGDHRSHIAITLAGSGDGESDSRSE